MSPFVNVKSLISIWYFKGGDMGRGYKKAYFDKLLGEGGGGMGRGRLCGQVILLQQIVV